MEKEKDRIRLMIINNEELEYNISFSVLNNGKICVEKLIILISAQKRNIK